MLRWRDSWSDHCKSVFPQSRLGKGVLSNLSAQPRVIHWRGTREVSLNSIRLWGMGGDRCTQAPCFPLYPFCLFCWILFFKGTLLLGRCSGLLIGGPGHWGAPLSSQRFYPEHPKHLLWGISATQKIKALKKPPLKGTLFPLQWNFLLNLSQIQTTSPEFILSNIVKLKKFLAHYGITP